MLVHVVVDLNKLIKATKEEEKKACFSGWPLQKYRCAIINLGDET